MIFLRPPALHRRVDRLLAEKRNELLDWQLHLRAAASRVATLEAQIEYLEATRPPPAHLEKIK